MGCWRILAIVPGEQISANTMCSSSQTVVVPLGERFGVPSSHTEATKPSRCSLRTRCMSVVNFTEVAMVHSPLFPGCTLGASCGSLPSLAHPFSFPSALSFRSPLFAAQTREKRARYDQKLHHAACFSGTRSSTDLKRPISSQCEHLQSWRQ